MRRNDGFEQEKEAERAMELLEEKTENLDTQQKPNIRLVGVLLALVLFVGIILIILLLG